MNYEILVCFLLVCPSIIAQSPPDLKFENSLEPNWTYVSYDSNFVQAPGDPFSSPYWGRQPMQVEIVDSSIYILELVFSQSPYGGAEGFLLHSINKNGGIPNWINYNNTYVGNVFREAYFEECFMVNDKEIHVVGMQDVDTIDFTFPNFGFFARPIRRIIDNENGALNEVVVGEQIILNELGAAAVGINFIYLLSDLRAVQLNSVIENRNNNLFKHIDIYPLNEQMELDTNSNARLTYNGEQDSSPQAEKRAYPLRLSGDTVVISFSKLDTFKNNVVEEFVLQWVDISDPLSPQIRHDVDVTHLLNHPQNSRNEEPYFIGRGDQILLLQENEYFDGKIHKFLSASWFDNEGELLSHVDTAQFGKGEFYNAIELIGEKDGCLYLFGRKNNFEYDILRLTPFIDEIEVVMPFHLQRGGDLESSYIWGGHFYSDNQMMVDFHSIAINDNDRWTSFENYLSFELEDLGITTSTTSTSMDSGLNVYPNPTTDFLQVHFSSNVSRNDRNRVQIVDLLGKVVWQKVIAAYSTSSVIDLTFLPTGTYQVMVISNGGASSSQTIVKH